MTYHTRRRLLGFASTLAMTGALLANGAYSQASTLPKDRLAADTPAFTSGSRGKPAGGRHFWNSLDLEPSDAWSRLRESFQWQDQWQYGAGHARVQHWIDEYSASPHNIVAITKRARPWLAWILERVESRGLPGEIALIPFVESSFDPHARSRFGAAGLWQIMPRTGDALGLRRNGAWDGRLDVVRSTQAALDYIELQADQWYEGDIELSLAAYNAGAGTVNRARRIALSRGHEGHYWDLELPAETMDYVPKLLAIAAIIAEPERYDVALPEIAAEPAFARVRVTRTLRLGEAARLAGVPRGQLADLNPGLRSESARPGQVRELLVPVDGAERLVTALDTVTPPSRGGDAIHVVQRGDTLSAIATRHAVAISDLARWNDIQRVDALQPGQQLTLSGR
ncbi:transglycosylase SLT domain-containing protein [Halomonas nitroreducens]|uniref:LysM peptidoglycan-binding domain-containing protein n=1 Tax=Halomonas nitroreducens TaxID=447425 RepID=A0A3S0JX27_9GAMM|nr:transglycosylase SLT domain-containing protein [Halomonas nitroreducens]RTR04978.1 LysM peptidoglycan-binding domain-containing protein [Halomonas nitroreducens]